MLDLSPYGLTIGRANSAISDWFSPVLNRGRGAAFIDTGFLKALISERDQYHSAAKSLYSRAASGTNFYTTSLVLAEVVRQVAKEKGIDHTIKKRWFEKCTAILIDSNQVFVCHPPRDILLEAYNELKEARLTIPALDLCDLLSIFILDYAEHRRVFGFDNHFQSFGAMLEP